MLRKDATKAQKAFTIIYLIIQIVSTAMYVLHLFKHKFGCKESRTIGDFNVQLNSDRFEGESIFAETWCQHDNAKNIVVKTDLYFRLMPRDIQDCILAHECGHHLYSTPVFSWCALGNERSIEDEHKADTYSVQLYGKDATLKMLKYLFVFSLFNSEISKRIKLVKEEKGQ